MSLSELMIDIPAEHEANVFGQFDAYAKKLERTFHVTLIARDGSMKIVGENTAAEKTHRVLTQLLELSRRGNTITEQNVDYAISLVFEDQEEGIVEIDRDLICHTLQGKPIKPKTLGQKKYVDSIREGMITFGLGPAGTGKTYLAMAMAITAFKRNEVNRIILTRPAIEAGEKLGFLPGDLQSKVDPADLLISEGCDSHCHRQIGFAGTGRTYLAVAAAVAAFRERTVNRIILTRPAVEAGERLGFLPGDLQNKVDPYLRPLYDALYDMLGPETYQKYLERGSIEVAPLAYMRGRTLDRHLFFLQGGQNALTDHPGYRNCQKAPVVK